ncbi:MAG TPA: DUF6174 domain-containing protein [Longimicrobium sp.]|jgi:hypothetical protein
MVRSLRPLFFAVLLLAGCDNATLTVDPAATAEERQWQAQRLDDYRYDFDQHCFCVPEQVAPVTIDVIDGRVSRVVVRATGQDITARAGLRWPTIVELFRIIDEARRNGTEPLEVRYDETRGYPTYIEAGTLYNDAGVIYTASNLRPL